MAALKAEALLNESVGAGYLDRNWPPALEASGTWPLSSLRQAFLNGTLTRLLDPDKILRAKIAEFVARGDFGLASGQKSDGTFERVWYEESVASDEIAFEADVFLLKKARAKDLKRAESLSEEEPDREAERDRTKFPEPTPAGRRTPRIVGTLRPELWNRLGTKVLPKLRPGSELRVVSSGPGDPMATESLDIRMARLEGSYAQIDRRLATIEVDLRELRRDTRQQFYWVVGLIVVTILVPIALRFLP